jgi:hypothetical protein
LVTGIIVAAGAHGVSSWRRRRPASALLPAYLGGNPFMSITAPAQRDIEGILQGRSWPASRRGYREAMRIAMVVLGVFVALFGLLFTLQGFGVVGGSPMSNTVTWSILGPIIALIGIGIAFAAARGRRT